jgi:hypothetical protein
MKLGRSVKGAAEAVGGAVRVDAADTAVGVVVAAVVVGVVAVDAGATGATDSLLETSHLSQPN